MVDKRAELLGPLSRGSAAALKSVSPEDAVKVLVNKPIPPGVSVEEYLAPLATILPATVGAGFLLRGLASSLGAQTARQVAAKRAALYGKTMMKKAEEGKSPTGPVGSAVSGLGAIAKLLGPKAQQVSETAAYNVSKGGMSGVRKSLAETPIWDWTINVPPIGQLPIAALPVATLAPEIALVGAGGAMVGARALGRARAAANQRRAAAAAKKRALEAAAKRRALIAEPVSRAVAAGKKLPSKLLKLIR